MGYNSISGMTHVCNHNNIHVRVSIVFPGGGQQSYGYTARILSSPAGCLHHASQTSADQYRVPPGNLTTDPEGSICLAFCARTGTDHSDLDFSFRHEFLYAALGDEIIVFVGRW